MPAVQHDSAIRDVAINYWTESERDSTRFFASLDVFTRDGRMKTLELSCDTPLEEWDNFDLKKKVVESMTPTRLHVNKPVDGRSFGRL